MTPNERADVLEQAADYIDEHGWYQGDFSEVGEDDFCQGDRPRCCALGALYMVIEGEPFSGALDLELYRDLSKAAGTGLIDEWNDAPERTKEEVTGAMRACAAQLRAAS